MSDSSDEKALPVVGVLGGTGALGGGLVRRWARNGYRVVVGSRTTEKGEGAAAEVIAELGAEDIAADVRGTDNPSAAGAADVVVLTVPFAHQKPTLESVRAELAGKILVDCTVPLVPPKVARVQLPPEGSAAVAAQEFLGDEIRVVSAFQNVGAEHLRTEDAVHCDVLVTGNSKDARAEVIELVRGAGLDGWHAGALVNSAATEALTSVLIFMNKRYGIHGAGIRITGEPTKS